MEIQGKEKPMAKNKVVSTYPDAELLARLEAAAKADNGRALGPMVLILAKEALDMRDLKKAAA
jgi:hypothetical protein